MKAVDPVTPEGNLLFSTQKVFKCTSLPFQLDNNFTRNKKFESLSKFVNQIFTLLYYT